MMDFKNFEKIENKIIIGCAIILAIFIFFGTTMTINGVEQPQIIAGTAGVLFMSLMVSIAYGAAWGLNWLLSAGWKK